MHELLSYSSEHNIGYTVYSLPQELHLIPVTSDNAKLPNPMLYRLGGGDNFRLLYNDIG